jgi:GNAT superfamily N-acetyltransferase
MYSIRPATLADISILNPMIAESSRVLMRDVYSPQQIESAIATVFGVDTELIEDQTYYAIVHESGILCGCGGWSKRKKLFGGNQLQSSNDASVQTIPQATLYANPATDPARIRAFFVHPDFARQGLGTLLLTHCETQAHAQGFTVCALMATLSGVKLYAQAGYARVEDIRYTMSDGVEIDFCFMTKILA